MGLVILSGPAKEEGAVSTTEIMCEESGTTGLCPFRCSGGGPSKQQCEARASVPTKAVPFEILGGMPFTDAAGAQQLQVAIVDFYNHIYQTALEPVVVTAEVDFVDNGLGFAWVYSKSRDGGEGTNCTSHTSEKNQRTCAYALSKIVSEKDDDELSGVVPATKKTSDLSEGGSVEVISSMSKPRLT